MPSSVSGEPNTTPFSAEQKVTNVFRQLRNQQSQRGVVPKEQDLSMQRPVPKTPRVVVTRTPTDVRYHKHSKISHFISPCCTYKDFIIVLLTSA